MKNFIAGIVFILVTACTEDAPGPVVSPPIPSFSDHSHYSDVREQFLQTGWSLVPAKCGNGYICSEEFPELVSAPDGANSRLFVSGSSSVRIYAKPIADGLLVERIEHVR